MIRLVFVDSKGAKKNLGEVKTTDAAFDLMREHCKKLFTYPVCQAVMTQDYWEKIIKSQKAYTISQTGSGCQYQIEDAG